MAQLERRIRKLDTHGTPKPELVKAWVGFLHALLGLPGVAAMTPEEGRSTTQAEAATAWARGGMWMET
jgi:hypothetical protein